MAENFNEVYELLIRSGSDKKTAATPYPIMGSWASAHTWADAQTLILQALENQGRTAMFLRIFASDVLKEVGQDTALMNAFGQRIERFEHYAQKRVHGNADPRTYTLYHASGNSISGNRKEIAAAANLSQDRIRDLLTGRRPYVRGWAMDLETAKAGPRPPGRPKKVAPEPEQFFEDGAVEIF